jgi:TolB-like protein/AraC-like DNA-binding protein/Tfp pilus assembly protein PilF
MSEEQSMDQVFLTRLTEIVEANLGNEQFGVKELAREMGMSRSQIHRKLRSLVQKSGSQFIREIRLQKAMDLLQQNVATVSEIAYRVGFGSPTYFNKCFHDFYGFPPGEVRKKSVGIAEREKEFVPSGFITTKGRLWPTRKHLMIPIGLCLAIVLVYLFFPPMWSREIRKTRGTKILEKSIAVLPFKNLSEDQSNQYFADGMMEDILNRLSHIHELKVISRYSSEQYRASSKSLPQIANELGVSYILDGSVQKCGDKARIFVQLIEAKRDQFLWSGKYDATLEKLLSLQSDVAKRVASELEAVLTPEEIHQVERKRTENMEAYNLYLKGRFFWYRRTEEGLKKSLIYFEQSIARDSSYALAYAGLADAYCSLAWWGWYPRKKGYAKAKELAQKALSLAPNLSEAHTTLGAIALWSEWNWTEAEEKLKRAIELNPNYATAHQYYAQYLSGVGKIHEAIEEMSKAIELNPLSVIMYSVSGCLHYQVGYYEQALTLHHTVLDMNQKLRFAHIDIFYIYLQQGKDAAAVDELKKYLAKDSLDKKQIPSMEDAFERSGRRGVLLWLVDLQIAKKTPECYFIAELYAKLGHKEKALDWLEMAFEERVGLLAARFKRDHNLENLHSEPRYKALLQKMGLED